MRHANRGFSNRGSHGSRGAKLSKKNQYDHPDAPRARESYRQNRRDYRRDEIEFGQGERYGHQKPGRYSEFGQERGRARVGRRGEYNSTNDQDFYEENSGRSPWRDTYDGERRRYYGGMSQDQKYNSQMVGSREWDYDSNENNQREARYGTYRDRDERWMNNYDNQDEDIESEYDFRQSRY